MPQNINQPSHSSAELGPAQPPLVIIFYPFLTDRPTDQPMKGDVDAPITALKKYILLYFLLIMKLGTRYHQAGI